MMIYLFLANCTQVMFTGVNLNSAVALMQHQKFLNCKISAEDKLHSWHDGPEYRKEVSIARMIVREMSETVKQSSISGLHLEGLTKLTKSFNRLQTSNDSQFLWDAGFSPITAPTFGGLGRPLLDRA